MGLVRDGRQHIVIEPIGLGLLADSVRCPVLGPKPELAPIARIEVRKYPNDLSILASRPLPLAIGGRQV
jgi:hypothetical protein